MWSELYFALLEAFIFVLEDEIQDGAEDQDGEILEKKISTAPPPGSSSRAHAALHCAPPVKPALATGFLYPVCVLWRILPVHP